MAANRISRCNPRLFSPDIRKPRAIGSRFTEEMKRKYAPPTANTAAQLCAPQTALAGSCTAGIDIVRVAALKAAIANGELPIDTVKIADGLMTRTRDLLSTQSSS